MPKPQSLFAILVLAMAGLIYAQTTDSRPQAPSTGPSVASMPTQSATNPQVFNQLEVLTPTMGVDFGPYLTRVVQAVRQNWYKILPPSVYPPTSKQGKVSIEFVILKDGSVARMTLHKDPGMTGLNIALSNDIELDRAAWGSITASNPFAALPKEFPGQNLGLRFYYFYNPQSITISPGADVRLAAGSTQQFSASGKGIDAQTVSWIISGPACSKSPCGTITDDGLYTAPADIPNPPTVFVEASVRTGVNLPAKTKLTIVPAIPSH